MSYLGNSPESQNFVAGADQFSGTGSQTAFTLSRNVNTVFDIFVTVSNVPQDPFTAYTVAGNTLTFDGAPPSGTNNIDVVYRATNVQTFVPSPGATVGGSFGIQGNLNFFGTGNRITGDFSNATIANRVMFQSSTTNGQTSIGVLPNGTSTFANLNLFGGTDPANASVAQYVNTGTEVILNATKTGTGTYLPMTFYTGGSESMRLSATSKAVILAGGDTSANGTGITFPATQSASSNANTLDDYEEGTWTPQLTFGNANVGMTGTFSGRYTKIGNVVTLNAFVQLSSKGSSTGAAQITNLPFNPVTVSQPFAAASIYVASGSITLGAGQIVEPNINGTVTEIDLNGVTTTTGVDFNLTQANFAASGSFWLNATYITNT